MNLYAYLHTLKTTIDSKRFSNDLTHQHLPAGPNDYSFTVADA